MSALLSGIVHTEDTLALADERVRYSWRELDRVLDRIVNGMLALDLGPHRRVAVVAANSAETVLAYVGGLLAGASTCRRTFTSPWKS